MFAIPYPTGSCRKAAGKEKFYFLVQLINYVASSLLRSQSERNNIMLAMANNIGAVMTTEMEPKPTDEALYGRYRL
jgi:hypothetical protein